MIGTAKQRELCGIKGRRLRTETILEERGVSLL